MESTAVKSRIRYLKDSWRDIAGIPIINSGDDRRQNTDFRDVEISDARPLQEQGLLDLDTNGFILTKHETKVRSFDDTQQIETTYIDELIELLGPLTGAEKLIPNNYLVRNEDPVSGQDWFAAYARFMHLDYDVGYGNEVMRETLAKNGYPDAAFDDGFLFRDPSHSGPYDMAIYGVWQPIDNVVQRNPLTLMDARCVKDEDLISYYLQGGLGALPYFDSEQKLYYFPDMQPDEAIIFKHMDTRAGFARQCPHTSFDDPNTPSDPLGRRSIEFRVIAVFDRSSD